MWHALTSEPKISIAPTATTTAAATVPTTEATPLSHSIVTV